MEDPKDQVKKYLIKEVNPLLKPMLQVLVRQRPTDIMQFILQYAQKQIDARNCSKVQKNQQISEKTIQEVLSKEEEEALKRKLANRKKNNTNGKKNSRRGISAEVFGEFNKKNQFKPKFIQKSQQSINFIKRLLMKSIMFQSLSEENLKIVIDAMEDRKVVAQELIIKEGQDGDMLYIIGDGQYECTKVIGGKKTYLKTYKPGELFGELSLMYNAKRAASIKCVKPGILFALDRHTFTHIIQQSAINRRKEYEKILDQIQILSDVKPAEKEQLYDALREERFEANDYVVKQGETGDRLYFVIEGYLVAEKQNPKNNKKEVVFKYQEKQYFGEISLIKNTVRQASIKAVTKCKLLSIGREEFKRLLGPIEVILQRNIDKYKKFLAK